MQKSNKLHRIKSYTIDLTIVKGKGEFNCPSCGTLITPDDETEDVYTILEPVMNGENLEKIVLKCNTCKSEIHLIGFELLGQI